MRMPFFIFEGMNLSLPKAKRIKKRDDIKLLFTKGKRLQKYPIQLVYTTKECEESAIKIGVSVPKRRFKKAVDRNRIKRLMREAYRINQGLITNYTTTSNRCLLLMFVYIGKQAITYSEIEQKITPASRNVFLNVVVIDTLSNTASTATLGRSTPANSSCS